MRRVLDALYLSSGAVAGFFLILIALLSLAQIVARLLGYAAYSFDEFAGYCMAASSFLGLTYTFRCNEHVRVSLLIDHVGGHRRRAMELACLAVTAFLIGFFAWFVVEMTWFSYRFDDVSQGLVPVKLWIPQSGMAAGLLIYAVALLDDIVTVLRGGEPSYQRAARSRRSAISENV